MLTDLTLLVLNAVASFITTLLLARFYMQWARVSFRNQLGHFVIQTTDWAVLPARRIVPAVFGLDMATFTVAWLIQVLLILLGALMHGMIGADGVIVLALLRGLIEVAELSVWFLIATAIFRLDKLALAIAWALTVSIYLANRYLNGQSGTDGLLTHVMLESALQITTQSIWFLTIALIVNALLSWIAPNVPAYFTLNRFLNPYIRPIQRFISPVANIDLSPIVLILLLRVALKLVHTISQNLL